MSETKEMYMTTQTAAPAVTEKGTKTLPLELSPDLHTLLVEMAKKERRTLKAQALTIIEDRLLMFKKERDADT